MTTIEMLLCFGGVVIFFMFGIVIFALLVICGGDHSGYDKPSGMDNWFDS